MDARFGRSVAALLRKKQSGVCGSFFPEQFSNGCSMGSTLCSAPVGHPLHKGDSHCRQKYDVEKAAFAEQQSRQPEHEKRQSNYPDHQF